MAHHAERSMRECIVFVKLALFYPPFFFFVPLDNSLLTGAKRQINSVEENAEASQDDKHHADY